MLSHRGHGVTFLKNISEFSVVPLAKFSVRRFRRLLITKIRQSDSIAVLRRCVLSSKLEHLLNSEPTSYVC